MSVEALVDGGNGMGLKTIMGMESCMDCGYRMRGEPMVSMEARVDSSNRVCSETMVRVEELGGGLGRGDQGDAQEQLGRDNVY